MLFLFGSQTIRKVTDEQPFSCPVCQSQQTSYHMLEKNYFTLFFIRLLPLDIVADYLECTQCQHSFNPENLDMPAYILGVQQVLAYLMLGYGVKRSKQMGTDICKAKTDHDWDDDEMYKQLSCLDDGHNLFTSLNELSFHLNDLGKIRIVESACLMANSLSELEYEDRLRLNLISSALGVSHEFVKDVLARM